MNKQELVDRIAGEMSVTKTEARQFINVFQDTLTIGLRRDDSVVLQGFGMFRLWDQTKRVARNPKTKEEVMLQPRRSVKFKAGVYLLKALNKEK